MSKVRREYNKRAAFVYSNTDKTRELNPYNAVREVFDPSGAVYGAKIENKYPEIKDLIQLDSQPVGSGIIKAVDTVSLTDLAFFRKGDKGYISLIDKVINEPVHTFEVVIENDKMTTKVKERAGDDITVMEPKIKQEEINNYIQKAAIVFNEFRQFCDKDQFVANLKKFSLVKDGKVDLDTLSKSFLFIEAVLNSVADKDMFLKAFNEEFETDIKNIGEINNKFNFFYLTGLKLSDLLRANRVLEKLAKAKTPQEEAEILQKYNEKDIFYFSELNKAAKNLDISLSVRKANFNKIGYNANGNIVVLKNETVNFLKNGTIHSDLGFAELTKEARDAMSVIEKYYYKKEEDDRPTVEEAQEAEDVLREKVTKLLETDNFKYSENVKDILTEMDISKLNEESPKELNNFKTVFDYYIKKTKINFMKDHIEDIYPLDDILTKKDKKNGEVRIRYNSLAVLENYGADFNGIDKKTEKSSIVIVTKLPQVAVFSTKFYQKTKTAITANVYFANDEIVDIKSGVTFGQYLKTYAKLGNTLLAVMNMEDGKNAKKYAIELNNIMKFQFKGSDGVKKLTNISGQYKKFIDAVGKGFLKEIQKKLNDGDIDGVKEFISKAFENAKEKTPVYALKEFLKEYEMHRNEIYANNKIAFAGKMKKVREAIIENKSYDEIKESLNKNEKSIYGAFVNKIVLAKDALQIVKEKDIEHVYEKNPDVEENSLQYMNVEATAKSLAYVFRNNSKAKPFYTKTENNRIVFVPNLTYGRSAGGIINPLKTEYEYGNVSYVLNKDDYTAAVENTKEFTELTNSLVKERGEELKKLIEANKKEYTADSKYFRDVKIEGVSIDVGELKTQNVTVTEQKEIENDVPNAPEEAEAAEISINPEDIENENIPEPDECDDCDIDITEAAIKQNENVQASISLDKMDI